MANWANLENDVLGVIALKMEAIEDLVYFSAVCRSWNYVFSVVKSKWKPLLPCLLLPEKAEQNPQCLRQIFCLSKKKCYLLNLPETFGARCWGSSCGWIVTFGYDLDLCLFNPLTKARISLPPQSTMPNQEPVVNAFTRKYFVRKSIVLRIPHNDRDDLIVMALVGNWKRSLAFARPGDRTWTPVECPWPHGGEYFEIPPLSHRVSDVVCFEGQILILYMDGSVGLLDIFDLDVQGPVKAKEYIPAYPKGPLEDRFDSGLLLRYLVDSEGELLMVLQQIHELTDDEARKVVNYETDRFEVYRYNFNTGEWEKVRKLGDLAIFVGDSHSVAICASNATNCKSNAIYFTDVSLEHWELGSSLGGHDMGIFDMQNEGIEKFYDGDDWHTKICSSFWFMPRF